MTWPKIWYPIYDLIVSGQLQFKNPWNSACDKPLRNAHSCRKHHDEEVASSKQQQQQQQQQKTNSKLEWKNRYPIYYQNGDKMAKTDTLFMTKVAEKP